MHLYSTGYSLEFHVYDSLEMGNYWHRIEIIQGLGLGGGAWGNFLDDITVLYLDCAIDEMTMHFSRQT